jgi:hypothetical protein
MPVCLSEAFEAPLKRWAPLINAQKSNVPLSSVLGPRSNKLGRVNKVPSIIRQSADIPSLSINSLSV